MKDGRTFTKEGTPTAGLEELKKKYRICAGYVLPEKKVTKSMDLALKLEKMDHVNTLMQLMY